VGDVCYPEAIVHWNTSFGPPIEEGQDAGVKQDVEMSEVGKVASMLSIAHVKVSKPSHCEAWLVASVVDALSYLSCLVMCSCLCLNTTHKRNSSA
jgi:hypothetical protein